VASGRGGRRAFFGGWGSKWAPVAAVAVPVRERRRDASGRARQGRGGEMPQCLCRLGPGRTRGTCGRTRALFELTHFGSKSEAKMDARGHVQTTLSIWMDRVAEPNALSTHTTFEPCLSRYAKQVYTRQAVYRICPLAGTPDSRTPCGLPRYICLSLTKKDYVSTKFLSLDL
jgi:hypothetical protein